MKSCAQCVFFSLTHYILFLQIYHHYEIQFSFKDTLGEDLSSDPLQNLHVKVMDVKPTEDGKYSKCLLIELNTCKRREMYSCKICNIQSFVSGLGHEVLLELTAHKEKLLREKIVLFDEHDKEKTVTLNIHARVLGTKHIHNFVTLHVL